MNLLVIAASLVSYIIFKNYEPNKAAPLIILLGAIPLVLSYTSLPWFSSAFMAILITFSSYYTLILLFTVTYRLSPLHPLAKFPGPILCKLSQFWLVWITSSGKQYIYYQKLHEKYGDIVRVGPNELSIRDASAISQVLGVPQLPKGPFWDGRIPDNGVRAVIMIKDPLDHASRRRLWNHGFSTAALKEYEAMVVENVKELMRSLEQQEGQVIDIAKWMTYFAFDFMGNFSFSKPFGLVSTGRDTDGLWDIVEYGVSFAAIMAHVPWMGLSIRRIPHFQKNAMALRRFAGACAMHRIQEGSNKKDLFYHLMDEENHETVKPDRMTIISDGFLAVVAGSDTTASAFSALWYYLLSNLDCYEKLQAEIDEAFPRETEPLDMTRQAGMPYLNACINEALRLLPPVPSGVQRSIPSGGKVIAKSFIPGGTNLFIHTYSVHRDVRNFSPNPDRFWPERWLPTTKTEAHNTNAFTPFSYGPANCVGKNLALLELRAVVCYIMQRFTISINDIKRLETWEDDFQDFFTTKWGSLNVYLRKRF